MPEHTVIDSSVAAKWFLEDEDDVDLANDIFAAFLVGDIELHAPYLFSYEVCSLLAKACAPRGKGGRSRISKENAVMCVQRFFDLPIQLYKVTEEECLKALEMTIDCSKGYYDMAYVGLAEKLSCQWCTADEKVLQSVPKNFPSCCVLLLSTLR